MKMKILTVAVFCAYFVAAFSKGFNRTMSGKLTGKALIPLIVHSPEITRKLSTLLVINSEGNLDSLGVLLGRDRIAFPERSWEANKIMQTYVYCFVKWRRPLILRSVYLKNRIPEEKRLYLAEGIVEVELVEEVPHDCWPPREYRYTECATENEMKREDDIFAITLALNDKDILEKPYVVADFIEDKYVKIRYSRNFPFRSSQIVPGEPLFHRNKIAGMYVSFISDKEGCSAEQIKYVLFRKQSIGQSSN